MNLKLFFFLPIVLLTIAVVSGCYSQRELTDIAIVTATGLDKSEDGKYVQSFQIVDPGNISSGEQAKGGGQGPPITVYSAKGNNVSEINQKISKKVSRRLYFSHTQLLIISEKIAREDGLDHILDAFERDNQYRSTMIVVIAKGSKAEDFIKTLTPIDKNSGRKIVKSLEITENTSGENIKVNLKDVIDDLMSRGKEPLISGVELIGSKEKGQKMDTLQKTEPESLIEVDGMALFKNGKLVNWISGKTCRGVSIILKKTKIFNVNLDWKGKKNVIAYQSIRSNTDVSAKFQNNRPVVAIQIEIEGRISEANVPIDLSNPKVLVKLEKKIEKKIQKEIYAAINKAKKDKTDVFGFGELLYRSYPNKWKKIERKWNDVYFPEVQTKVGVNVFIRQTGSKNKSHMTELDS